MLIGQHQQQQQQHHQQPHIHHHLPPPHLHHHHFAAIAMAHHAAHGHAAAAASHAHHTVDFLNTLTVQSPLDVYDIHETGWRRALLLAKRDRHEFLVRYIGWDTKWDEWIRGTSGRLAPANSKTASLAYTGFKGPKSADEIASLELGRDWNTARQEGVMCDVLFALHGCHPSRRAARTSSGFTSSVSPIKRNNSMRRDEETKVGATSSQTSTPATSPMVRGLSGLGLLSPSMNPSVSPDVGQPHYFAAHSHIINMRCPDLLKASVISLPPITTYEEPATAPPTPFRTASVAPQEGERKDESGGRSLADQEQAAAGATVPAASSILNYSLTATMESVPSSISPDVLAPSASPAAVSVMEEKSAKSLDEDDDMPPAAAGGSLSRSMSLSGIGISELHPSAITYDVSCVPNVSIMQNLLNYLYTGDLQMTLIPTIRHVFELATVANLLHLDRMQDLCALALNRMLTQDNFLMALKLGLHFQSRVLGNLDSIMTSIYDAHTAATQSLQHEFQYNPATTTFNAKIHPHLSPLVRVCFEYIMNHWDVCFAKYENLLAFQQLPPPIFQLIMRFMPMKNLPHAQFSVIYPTIHPQPCNLTNHFKHLYEQRTEENTDFRVVVGEGEEEYIVPVHKAVLACRSEYFRALFRCSFEEGKDSCVRLDATQHNPASVEALVKYLYYADLKVDPNCGVYLSNCTDFFGLSSNALEHACQELVSQHHCLKVLKSAWKSCNEGLFKRACRFIDWTTLAQLMNGGGAPVPPQFDLGAAHQPDDEDQAEEQMEGDDDEVQPAAAAAAALDEEAIQQEDAMLNEDVMQPLQPLMPLTAASSTVSPATSSHSTPNRSRSQPSSLPPSPLIDASDVEMWKAIVQEKANPTTSSSAHKSSASKRART